LANIKSSKKRIRVSHSKTLRNKMIKSNFKTVLRKAFMKDATIDCKMAAIRAVDRAISKGILHKNNGARKKSILSKQIKNLAA